VTRAWHNELWRLAVLLLSGVLLGALFDQVLTGLLVSLGIYLAWHLYNLNRLVRWLNEGKSFQPPEASGIWDVAFEYIYRLQQRNQQRKRNLHRLLKRLHKMTSALPDATVELRPGSEEIEWWNTAAARYLGFEYPRDSGQRISNLIRHPTFLEYLHGNDYGQGIEIPSPVNEGQTLRIRIVPYAGDRRLLVARDMTHVQKLERMRQDFVANVSHELRSPLTVVSGYLETLLDDNDLDKRCVDPLRSMQKQTRRMNQLVKDLITLSRLESEEPGSSLRAVYMPELIAQVVDQAREFSGEEAHVIESEVDDSLCLNGVENELYSAFSNLLFNAVRYTPAGGQIRVSWARDGDSAVFSVTDTGAGIEAQHIPRLTERFYRVDAGRSRERGGTGLGLAIVRAIVQAYGGTIHASSPGPSLGSRFEAHFPYKASS
jgi:two-component system phosphate regulon sensor histidine kinase PhoR